MIACVILRPDGTVVEESVACSEKVAWVRGYVHDFGGVAADYGMQLTMERLGYRLHSFEVPLPAPQAEERKTEHP